MFSARYQQYDMVQINNHFDPSTTYSNHSEAIASATCLSHKGFISTSEHTILSLFASLPSECPPPSGAENLLHGPGTRTSHGGARQTPEALK